MVITMMIYTTNSGFHFFSPYIVVVTVPIQLRCVYLTELIFSLDLYISFMHRRDHQPPHSSSFHSTPIYITTPTIFLSFPPSLLHLTTPRSPSSSTRYHLPNHQLLMSCRSTKQLTQREEDRLEHETATDACEWTGFSSEEEEEVIKVKAEADKRRYDSKQTLSHQLIQLLS